MLKSVNLQKYMKLYKMTVILFETIEIKYIVVYFISLSIVNKIYHYIFYYLTCVPYKICIL